MAIFNEQCLNVDQQVFGDPEADEGQFPKNPNDFYYQQYFRPNQIHSWLTRKGGFAIEDNPHTAENSGIPTARLKNASLKEMLGRMDHW